MAFVYLRRASAYMQLLHRRVPQALAMPFELQEWKMHPRTESRLLHTHWAFVSSSEGRSGSPSWILRLSLGRFSKGRQPTALEPCNLSRPVSKICCTPPRQIPVYFVLEFSELLRMSAAHSLWFTTHGLLRLFWKVLFRDVNLHQDWIPISYQQSL